MQQTLSLNDLETALRNSGYDFNSHITDAECVGTVDHMPHISIYEIKWDVSNHEEPVTFCDLLYVSYDDETHLHYADI